MIILSLDTATESCSVSVSRDHALLVELNDYSFKTHAAHILPMVQYALKLSDILMADVDGYAVTIGPGSFTGLRIGLSTVKGFAAACGKPVVGVSTLQVLSRQAPLVAPVICPMIDARRNEVYYAIYENTGDSVRPVYKEGVGPVDKVLALIDRPCLFIGSGALVYHEQIRERFGSESLFAENLNSHPRAGHIAEIAWLRFEKGESDDIDGLIPRYIRKSDAQVHSAP